MIIWIMVFNERHEDPLIEAWGTPAAAIERAKTLVAADGADDVKALDTGEVRYFSGRRERYLYHVIWGSEGDSAYVIESELKGPMADREMWP